MAFFPHYSIDWGDISGNFAPMATNPAPPVPALDSVCDYAVTTLLVGSPSVPWFRNDAADAKALAQLKRWVSTNLREWPLCRYGHQIKLVPVLSRAVGGDGEMARAGLCCDGCSR